MKSVSIRHLALITLAIAGSASANTYITLDGADNTVFANQNGQRINVNVAATATTGWNNYSEFLGAGERMVYTQKNSQSVYIYNADSGASEKLVNFADPVGSKYAFTLGACTNGGAIEQKGLTMTTPAGTYKNVVHMVFSNNCFDGGTTEAYFAPKVGVIKWSTTSIAGPVSFALTNGVIGGKVFGATSLQTALKVATSFPQNQISLNGNTTEVGATMDLTNTSNQDLVIHFEGGQEFELSLLDAKSTAINTWGARVRFFQGAHDITIAAGKTVSFGGTVGLTSFDGQPLTAGQYALRIEVLGSPVTTTGVAVSSAAIRAESPLTLFGR